MKLSLVRNTQPDRETRPFFLSVDAGTDVIEPRTAFYIPIDRYRPAYTAGIVKEIYSAEVCGFRVEAGNVNQIVRLVESLLAALVNVARLPTYAFVSGQSWRVYPVYTLGDEVFVTTPGGPVFRHVELANVRRYLSRYLHDVGELGTEAGIETLHVRGVHSRSLRLIRPVFYLKKRIPEENEFWAPVFMADDGRSIYAYAASAKREVELTDGLEVLALRDVVAEALIADGRLKNNYDLRPDRLLPHVWADLEAHLKPGSQKLVMSPTNGAARPVELAVYQNHRAVVAVDPRAAENRPGLYVGRDLTDLRTRVARDCVRRRLIDNETGIRIVSAAPKAEEKTRSALDDLMRVWS